jgi:hypothetical protein
MKNQVKKFGQYIKESDEFGMELGTGSNSVTIVDLLDCYIKTNHSRGMVIAKVDVSNPARDLINGGIEFIVNPSEEEIGDAQYNDTYYAELYEDGRRIGEEEYLGGSGY